LSVDIKKFKILEEKLTKLSFRDRLTGLYSRHFYEEELSRLKTSRHFPVSVIYIDVNDLNTANNTLGHSEGDRLLQKVSAVLLDTIRTDDTISRVGGDDFVIFLPNTDKKTTSLVIKRIKQNIIRHNLDTSHPYLSLSIGFATALKGGEMDEAIHRADKQMYVNKDKYKKRASEGL
jgi:diguanylate cyclase (GGDEF)-like protein